MSHQLIVAIGRESGSGGLDIAHALAERLQLPLFDKSILQKAAEDKGVSAETLERYDERPYSPLFCRSVRGISSAPEDCVAQMQFELLRQHANAGESFVVLGRCAEEVLADRRDWYPSSSGRIWISGSSAPLCRRRKPWTSSSIRTGSGGSTMTSTAKVTGAMPNVTIW